MVFQRLILWLTYIGLCCIGSGKAASAGGLCDRLWISKLQRRASSHFCFYRVALKPTSYIAALNNVYSGCQVQHCLRSSTKTFFYWCRTKLNFQSSLEVSGCVFFVASAAAATGVRLFKPRGERWCSSQWLRNGSTRGMDIFGAKPPFYLLHSHAHT